MAEENIDWYKPIYLDASVAVKLFVTEEGSTRLQEFIDREGGACLFITEFAFYETLSVLKRKLLDHKLDRDGYFKAIAEMTGAIETGDIKIDSDFRPDSFRHFPGIWELAKKHSLDWSDALQVYAVLKGKRSRSRYESTVRFFTADQDLASAAKLEGLLVWNPAKEDQPPATSTR